MPRVGGKTDGCDDGMPLARGVDDEPFAFWPFTVLTWQCLLHAFFANLLINLSPADGNLMWACLLLGISYVGICYSEDHHDILLARVNDLWKQNLGNAHADYKLVFNSRYADALASVAGGGATDVVVKEPEVVVPKREPAPKAKLKTKAKGKAKAKAKATAATDPPVARGEVDEDEEAAARGEDDEDEEGVWDTLATTDAEERVE